MLRLVGAKHKQFVCSLNARIPGDITEKRVGIDYVGKLKTDSIATRTKHTHSSTQYSRATNRRSNVSISGWTVTECLKQSRCGLPDWEELLPISKYGPSFFARCCPSKPSNILRTYLVWYCMKCIVVYCTSWLLVFSRVPYYAPTLYH